jgi:hypothetical protein
MEKNLDVGLVQPLVLSKLNPSNVYSCGHKFNESLFCIPIRTQSDDMQALNNLESCSICSSMLRVEALRKIGLLNNYFKIYYKSSDLSFRMRYGGYKCACYKKAIAYNEGTKVSCGHNYHEVYYRMRNNIIFWNIHDKKKYKLIHKLYKEQLKILQEQFDNSIIVWIARKREKGKE